MIRVEMAYPDKTLSPNRSTHHMALWRAKKDAKEAASWATKAAMPRNWTHDGSRLPVMVMLHPIAGKAAMDKDNALACAKAHLDGIAQALGVDDKLFDPTIDIGQPVPRGALVITVGAPA